MVWYRKTGKYPDLQKWERIQKLHIAKVNTDPHQNSGSDYKASVCKNFQGKKSVFHQEWVEANCSYFILREVLGLEEEGNIYSEIIW